MSFLLLLVLLSAEDCVDNNSEVTLGNKLTETFQEVENDFTQDELSRENIFAFEKRAVQKLKDLADYINIYADDSLPKEFRLQARQMIEETFESEMEMQDYYKSLDLLEDSVVGVLYCSEKVVAFKTEINSINIADPFQKNTFSGYAGKLQFSQKIFNNNSNDTILLNIHKCNFETTVSKTEKLFGNESQNVWTISFTEIDYNF